MRGHDLVMTNVAVWSRPEADVIHDCIVVVRDGRVHSVSPMVASCANAGAADVPRDIPIVDAGGRILTAGFWNCHVHFTETVWSGARRADATKLQQALDTMLVSRGFTSVVDLASNSRDTLPLIARIESGELTGPRIRTATEAINPASGLPFYIKDSVPWFVRWMLPTPWSARGAARGAQRQLRKGAHVIKLFTGTYVKRDKITTMSPKVASAAVGVAHEHGALVFAHTSNHEGLSVALHAGVDVIAHVPSEPEGIDSLVRECAETGMRMIPTLHMFAHTVSSAPDYIGPIYTALQTVIAAGGRILFGTDVGYMNDYGTEGEMTALERCGLTSAEILASLTTEPAAAFGCADAGAIEPGMIADFTLLEKAAHPVMPRDLSRIAVVVKSGRVIYESKET